MADTAISELLSVKAKLGYGVGDFAANIVFNTINFYLLYFYTDVFLIGATAAGSILLIARLWDAFSDPLMGLISDHTSSRFGRKRPYLLYGALPLGLTFFLVLAAPDLGANARYVYALLTYIAYCTAYTVVNIPYGALTADMTLDTNERSSLTGYRMTFALIGSLVAAGATKPLTGLFAVEVDGFRFVAGLYGALAVIVTLISFAAVREKALHAPLEKASIGQTFSVIAENRPFQILLAAFVLHMICIIMVATVLNYFFKYNLEAEHLIPTAFLCLFVSAMLAIPLWVKLADRLGKKFAYNIGMAVLAAALIALYIIGERNITLTFALCVIGGVGLSSNYVCPWSMVADTVEYSQWKTGLRREGLIYGLWNFGTKVAMALSGFIAGVALDACGYIPNVVQGESALFGIRLMMTLIPAAFAIAGIVLVSFYPLDSASHAKIVREIAIGETSDRG